MVILLCLLLLFLVVMGVYVIFLQEPSPQERNVDKVKDKMYYDN